MDADRVRTLFESMPIVKYLRGDVVDIDTVKKSAITRVNLFDELRGQENTIPGPVIMAAADSAMGCAASTVINSDEAVFTIGMKIKFLKMSFVEDRALVCEARVVDDRERWSDGGSLRILRLEASVFSEETNEKQKQIKADFKAEFAVLPKSVVQKLK